MLGEFRDFLMRGNVVDLAVGLIAGVVFGAVVNSLVSDVIMQVVAAVVGEPDFRSLVLTVNDTPIRFGAFLTALLNFVLTMGAVFVCIVKPMNIITSRVARPAPSDATALVRECPECLSEIPSAARRCRACTAALAPV